MKKNVFNQRFKLVISDPLNNKIEKNFKTFVVDELITLYNGVKVYKNSYYEEFSDILLLNQGVHEPSEEFLFQEVLKRIKTKNPVMLELGSYWCFYSMSFLKKFPQGKSFCIEECDNYLEIGKKHFTINGLIGDFTKGFVGDNGINIDTFLDEKKIEHLNVLHCDIQGFELQMLSGLKKSLERKKIDYLFLSTHSNNLHYECISYLNKHEYRIISEVDRNETFCEDGIILAVSPVIDMDNIYLPKKSETIIITDDELNNLYNLNLSL